MVIGFLVGYAVAAFILGLMRDNAFLTGTGIGAGFFALIFHMSEVSTTLP